MCISIHFCVRATKFMCSGSRGSTGGWLEPPPRPPFLNILGKWNTSRILIFAVHDIPRNTAKTRRRVKLPIFRYWHQVISFSWDLRKNRYNQQSFYTYEPTFPWILGPPLGWVLNAQPSRTILMDTVISEVFARILFSRNFAYAKFRENKILAKWRNYTVIYWLR